MKYIIRLQVDGMQNVASDLAKVVCEERALIEECGDLLSGVQELQVYTSLLIAAHFFLQVFV